MNLLDRVVVPLRILLVVFFVGLVFGQVVSMPGQFAHLATEEPDLAHLRWPLTIWSILEIAAVQVVVVCTWRLLSLVRADRIFSEEAFRWVDLIVAALGVGWALFAGFALYVISKSDDPGTPILVIGMTLAGGVVLLVMVVMRALLHQATTLRLDLDAVI
ncbi:DUF2975 domain-containing protein [Nocardioides sp. W7]|uniref:DUF2975 domain-containing protein n=1 Tax=Nocardioides sp. W7 TaxID=2931390 RepID=UPI001FD16FC2|nr:DUF2975 domain-containing protein [Nocardioides sp. W7]